tara:strand:- start:178 stop:375 length:198 start_codon:yes stop_codon:yes gene_type:complete
MLIKIMFSLCFVSYLSACSLGMTPDKTSVKVSNTMSSVDKANSDKDQDKNSLTVTVTQDFKWDSK